MWHLGRSRRTENCERCCSPTSSAPPRPYFRLGAEARKALLERHHALVRAELASFHGAEVDTAGDGFFATFASPCWSRQGAPKSITKRVRDLDLESRRRARAERQVIDGRFGGPTAAESARASGALAGLRRSSVSQTVKDLPLAPASHSRTPASTN